MTAQTLDRQLVGYRVGDADGRFPIFDATGSRLYPGRWNTSSSPIIYAGGNFAIALLEKLVHGGGVLPDNQHFIEITVPPGVSYERFDTKSHPGWDGFDETICKTYGDQWFLKKRSLILLVKSAVTKVDDNLLINPEHPEFKMLSHSLHEPVYWDARLFVPPTTTPGAPAPKAKAKS